MKITDFKKCKPYRRNYWQVGYFIIVPLDSNHIECWFDYKAADYWSPSYEDLIADDWKEVKND